MRTFMKDRYDDDSASSDAYEDQRFDDESKIDPCTYKSLLLRTQEAKEADQDNKIDAKRFYLLNDETEY